VKVCIHQIELPASIRLTVIRLASNLGRPFCELERCGKVSKDFRYFILFYFIEKQGSLGSKGLASMLARFIRLRTRFWSRLLRLQSGNLKSKAACRNVKVTVGDKRTEESLFVARFPLLEKLNGHETTTTRIAFFVTEHSFLST
jgi:hypothetical protein